MGYIPTYATEVTTIVRNNAVQVESLNAFDDIVVGRTVFLETGVSYNITRAFDWEDTLFVVPTNGDVSFTTNSDVSNGIFTKISGSDILFTGAIGRMIWGGTDIISANGGKCFDFTAGPTGFLRNIFMENMRVQGFDAIGCTDGLTVLTQSIGFLFNQAGIDINNAFVIQMRDINWAGQVGNHMNLTGAITTAFIDTWIANPATGSAVLNIDPAVVTAGIQVSSSTMFTSGGGTWFDPTGLDQTDSGVIVSAGAINITRSNWIGSTGFTGGTTATVLTDTSTLVKIAGTYVNGETERFTIVGGVVTYIGRDSIVETVAATAQILMEPGIETDTIEAFLVKNGTEITSSKSSHTLDAVFQTPTSPVFECSENVPLVTGDTLEIRWRNISNATNITGIDAKMVMGI